MLNAKDPLLLQASAATVIVTSPKLSPVDRNYSKVVPGYSLGVECQVPEARVQGRNWNHADCRTPESTRPHYSPKTRRRLRLTFEFVQHEGVHQDGEEEEEKEDDVGKRRRTF